MKTGFSLIYFDVTFPMQSSEFFKITKLWKYFEKKKTSEFLTSQFAFIDSLFLVFFEGFEGLFRGINNSRLASNIFYKTPY